MTLRVDKTETEIGSPFNPAILIDKRYIYINFDSYILYNVIIKSYAEIFFDEVQNVLAFKFYEKDTQDAYVIRRHILYVYNLFVDHLDVKDGLYPLHRVPDTDTLYIYYNPKG